MQTNVGFPHSMEVEGVLPNDAIFDKCPVCRQLPLDACTLFSEFCVKIAKNGSLTQVMHEAWSAMPNFLNSKEMYTASVQIDEAGIRHHVMHCLGTREPAITKLITTNVVMVTMMKSTDPNKSLACAKLLLQSVGQESKS